VSCSWFLLRRFPKQFLHSRLHRQNVHPSGQRARSCVILFRARSRSGVTLHSPVLTGIRTYNRPLTRRTAFGQYRCMLGESENQFPLTRAALGTRGAQKQISISKGILHMVMLARIQAVVWRMVLIVSALGTLPLTGLVVVANGGEGPSREAAAVKVLDVQFEPLRAGKNIVCVKVQNPSSENRTVYVQIQSSNKPEGASFGWGHAFPRELKPQTTQWLRFAFTVFGPPSEHGNTFLELSDGFENWKADKTLGRRTFLFSDLQKHQTQPSQAVLPAVSDCIIQAFEELRSAMRAKDYERVRSCITRDMFDAEFAEKPRSEFARQIDLPSPFHWFWGEIAALKPRSVTRQDGVFKLKADLEGREWTVNVVYCDGQWKIDEIEGFMPSPQTDEGRDVWVQRLLPVLKKRATEHLDIYCFPGSTAEREIEEITRAREEGVRLACQLLGRQPARRICLVFFEDGESKLHVTRHQGDGWALGDRIVEVYNSKVKLDPYHETTHAIISPLGNPPAAFREGIAVYVSEQLGPAPLKDLGGGQSKARDFVRSSRKKGLWIPLEELLGYTNIGAQGERTPLAYAEAGDITRFLVERYGQEKFLEAYRELKSSREAAVQAENARVMRRIFGVRLSDLESQWIQTFTSKRKR